MKPQERIEAIRSSRVEPSMRLLLVMVASHMADTRLSCWVGTDTLAEETGLAERRVRDLLAEAEAAGLIERFWGEHRAKDIRIRWDTLAATEPKTSNRGGKRDKSDEPGKHCPPPGNDCRVTGKQQQGGGQSLPNCPADIAPEPVLNRDLNREENTPPPPTGAAPAPAGPSCVSPESSQPHTSEAAPGAASRGVRADAVSDGANTAPPTMETSDGRDDREPAGESTASPVREGGDGGRGGDERRDGPATGAGEASSGGGDEVSGGTGGADGADLTTLWAWISDERKRATAGAGALTLTPKMRTALRSRVAEHGDEAVRRAWTWVLYSAHPRAVFLRAGSYAHPKTFLRPDNCAEYVDLSRLSEAIGEKAAPPSPMQRTALAAWDRYIAPLLTDRRYHSQAPPPAYHADPAKHEVIRRAMYEAGGWAHLSKVRDRADDVAAFRQTFTATLARELERAA